MTVLTKPRHHAALEQTLTFGLRLTCLTGLHIGAGKNADLAGSDLPILRDGNGQPLVPGSSLRGVLRAGASSLASALNLGKLAPQIPESENEEALNKNFPRNWNNLSLLERLFGYVATDKKLAKDNPAYGSRLFISDLVGGGEKVPVNLRDGVAIDRETRTAARGAKFDYEAVPAGTCFEGKVRINNPEPYEPGLFAQLLVLLDEGILLVGGKKARGLGWVSVEVTDPHYRSAKDLLYGENPPPEKQWGIVGEKLDGELKSLSLFLKASAGN